MSLVNPGKRGILTVVALMLIIGVPGVIAYADDSDDTYTDYTAVDLSTYSSFADSNESLTPVVVSDGDVYSVSFTTNSSATYINQFFDGHLSDVSSFKLYLDFDDIGEVSSILLFIRSGVSYSSTVYSAEIDYDGAGWYVIDLSAIEQVSANIGDCYIVIATNFTEAVEAGDYSFDHAVYVGTSKTIFTDDVVELIVMIGGIALLICGTFALSFIDVNTPGKAVSYAKRGIRSAGNKMRRGKK